MVFGGEGAGGGFGDGLGWVVGYAGLHRDRVTQAGDFLTPVDGWAASNEVRLAFGELLCTNVGRQSF